MTYKLTIDGGLFRQTTLLPAMQTLKTWESEGKIEIFESDRAREVKNTSSWATKVDPVYAKVRSTSRQRPKTSAVSFQKISSVIYPRRDSHRLTMEEINNVAHLLQHHLIGNWIFVTTNLTDYIAGGKREEMNNFFKIVIMTPDEVVETLLTSEGWSKKSAR